MPAKKKSNKSKEVTKTKKAPVKKTAAKKSPVKKTAAKKSPVKKTAAKKTNQKTTKSSKSKLSKSDRYEEARSASINHMHSKKMKIYECWPKKHFKEILTSWKEQLQIEQDRTADKKMLVISR